MRFSVLASGSAGNAAFIRSGDTRILVDCGLSVRELTKRMAEIGEHPADLTAIIVTHEHGDHVGGLVRLAKYCMGRGRAVPMWVTRPTAEAINWKSVECPYVRHFEAGKPFFVGGIQISSFTVPHDAADPVAFCFADNNSKIGIATDLGFIPPALVSRFRTCDAIMIESNYDPDMLEACDRPQSIRDRISGRNGHLSNIDTSDYLKRELASCVRTVVLGHLSQETNREEMVHAGAMEVLQSRFNSGRPDLIMAKQDKGTGVINV